MCDYAAFEDIEANRTVVGTLTLVYNHHKPGLSERIDEIQHHAGQKVLAATHVHLDREHCLEVVVMKGRSSEVRHVAEQILTLRGVKHGRLVLTTTGKGLARKPLGSARFALSFPSNTSTRKGITGKSTLGLRAPRRGNVGETVFGRP